MLKKQNRLSIIRKKPDDAFFSSSLFNVRISNNDGNGVKFGFVVSKKIDKRAVVRNRTKRVLQSVAGNVLEKIRIGEDITVIAKKELDFERKDEIEKNLIEVLTKAGILK